MARRARHEMNSRGRDAAEPRTARGGSTNLEETLAVQLTNFGAFTSSAQESAPPDWGPS